MIHGGEMHGNRIHTDFSVNVNPCGMPNNVMKAVNESTDMVLRYPDYYQTALRRAVSESIDIPGNDIVFGNGASELFMAIVHALNPQYAVIPVPSFSGYEYALKACEANMDFVTLSHGNMEDDGFVLDSAAADKICGKLEGRHSVSLDKDNAAGSENRVLFITNPNNPTGRLIDDNVLISILERCEKMGVYTVLDECFIDFCSGTHSRLCDISKYKHMIIVNSYTKIFSIPGIRIGYAVCGDEAVIGLIQRQLPEWNVSVIAQHVGIACAQEKEFVKKTSERIVGWRTGLMQGLVECGAQPFKSDADFILFRANPELLPALMKKGIYIRDCSNFRGLCKGYFRTAVGTDGMNEILLYALRNIGRDNVCPQNNE